MRNTDSERTVDFRGPGLSKHGFAVCFGSVLERQGMRFVLDHFFHDNTETPPLEKGALFSQGVSMHRELELVCEAPEPHELRDRTLM